MSMNITQSLCKYKYSLMLAAVEIPFPVWGSGSPREDLDPPSNTWFMSPPMPTVQMASRLVQPFLQSLWLTDRLTDWKTDRQTDRPCLWVCTDRPHLRM